MKCLGKNCPNNCCSNKFIGLKKALKNCSSDNFVQIKLNYEEVDRISKYGRNDLIEKRNNEFFLKLNNDNSCKAFKNGECEIYEVRPDVCKLYPYYFDPFCGICIDKNCPGNFTLDETDDTLYQLLLNRINLFRREQNCHYFFDGYNILNKELKDMKKIKNFFEDIKKDFGINENCKIHLIPYFHCKIREWKV